MGCVQRVPVKPLPGAVDFTLERMGGGQYRLSQDRGFPVLVDVWATWCEPCRVALPALDRLAREYAASGLRVYALSVDADPSEVPPFVVSLGIKVPVLLDSSGNVADQVLRVQNLPSSFLFDPQGRLAYAHEGFPPNSEVQLREELKGVLGGGKP
jgi:thiol-disulfide isomerase/thioredoxin